MKISLKKFKNHLQFYMKILLKKISSFFTRKSLVKFFQNHTLENIFQKLSPRGCFWKFSKISPTSPKFNTHKKIVVHFFIPMLLLPLTPPLIYLKLKKFKGPKMDSLFFYKLIYKGIPLGKVTDSTLYNYYAQNKLIYKGILLGKVTDSTLYIHKHGGRRSIAGIKESFKGNAARARLARGFRNKKISREISCKKFKTHLQFYVKISNNILGLFNDTKCKRLFTCAVLGRLKLGRTLIKFEIRSSKILQHALSQCSRARLQRLQV